MTNVPLTLSLLKRFTSVNSVGVLKRLTSAIWPSGHSLSTAEFEAHNLLTDEHLSFPSDPLVQNRKVSTKVWLFLFLLLIPFEFVLLPQHLLTAS